MNTEHKKDNLVLDVAKYCAIMIKGNNGDNNVDEYI